MPVGFNVGGFQCQGGDDGGDGGGGGVGGGGVVVVIVFVSRREREGGCQQDALSGISGASPARVDAKKARMRV